MRTTADNGTIDSGRSYMLGRPRLRQVRSECVLAHRAFAPRPACPPYLLASQRSRSLVPCDVSSSFSFVRQCFSK